MITLGLAQASAGPDPQDNFDRIAQLAAQAKEAGCAALCFPEASLTGYFPEEAHTLALSRDHQLLSRLSALAQAQQMDLLVGFMEREDDRLFLTHGLWRPDGSTHFYRKTHLGQREQTVFTPGDTLEVFPLSCGLTAAIQLCVETHFPEITQTYSLRGAQVIFAPHASPVSAEKRRRIWQTYIPARSYDNRVYLACCNQWDTDRFGGGCMAADPGGAVIAALFEPNPGLLCFRVDPDRVRSYHREGADKNHHYYPGRRRPELYHTDTQEGGSF